MVSSTSVLERGLVANDLPWQRSLTWQNLEHERHLDTQVLNSPSEEGDSAAPMSTTPSSSAFANKDSGIMIAWYCFIGVSALVLCFVLVTLAHRWYYHRVQLPAQLARRAAEEAAREAALARMQANVSKFTAHENTQRTRDLCALLLPQTTEILEDDPRLCKLTRSSECTLEEEDTDEIIMDVEQASNALPIVSPTTCCSICLEEWKAGELICQSAGCRHVFHQTCIISWLVNHRSDCPACRQAFLPALNEEDEENSDALGNGQVEQEYEA